jgi:hypothetical protein
MNCMIRRNGYVIRPSKEYFKTPAAIYHFCRHVLNMRPHEIMGLITVVRLHPENCPSEFLLQMYEELRAALVPEVHQN